MRPDTDALLVIDVQNDFCAGGALAVPGGDEVVAPINAAMAEFGVVILTQDWHTPRHSSFASEHPGKAPFGTVEMTYGPQVLWPDHCIAGTHGAAFHQALETDRAQAIVRKGFHRDIDSYSAFFENDRKTPTGLAGYLRTRGVERVVCAGLALDFCVGYSALDAARLGLVTEVRMDLCRAIDLDGSLDTMREGFARAGIREVAG